MDNKMNDTKLSRDISNGEIPSVFVNEDLLEKAILPHYHEYNNYKKDEISDDFVKFKIYAPQCEDSTKLSSLSVQCAANGFIINEAVYLTVAQWNCIVDREVFQYCWVCGEIVEAVGTHRTEDVHTNKLMEHTPLATYDMSIIRKVNEEYHCGVCNQIFQNYDIDKHYETNEHKEILLFSMKKAADILNDVAATKTQVNDSCSFNSFVIHNSNVRNINDNEKNYDDDDYDIDDYENDDDNYDNEDDDYDIIIEEQLLHKDKVLYAEIANQRKAKEFIDVKVGTKQFRVKIDSFNMIDFQRNNLFFCMACKVKDKLNFKNTHCDSVKHRETLAKYKTLTHFSEYYIRQVDNTHCHCAHCNKLQLTSRIASHIERNHKKNTKSGKGATPKLFGKKSDSRQRQVSNSGVWTVTIHPFDRYICLSSLHYNFIKKSIKYGNVVRYSCGLCDVEFGKDAVGSHCKEVGHIEAVMRCPFVKQYGNNLVRMIKNSAHCGICNTIINNNNVEKHITESFHVALGNITLKKQDYRKSQYIDVVPTTDYQETNPSINLNFDSSEKPASPLNELQENCRDNTPKTDPFDTSIDSEESCKDFDIEEFVLLKFKNGFFKVTATSYHSLVPLGDPGRFCFVCDVVVSQWNLVKHVDARAHEQNLHESKFLEKYGDDFIRQMYLSYHCAICNSIISRSEVPKHLTCSLHTQLKSEVETYKKSSKFVNKDLKIFVAATQKESIYLNAKEQKPKIISKVLIAKPTETSNNKAYSQNDNINSRNDNDKMQLQNDNDKACKVFMMKECVIMVNWESYNGVFTDKSNVKCLLCNIKMLSVGTHFQSTEHKDRLKRSTFVKQYQPNLIRVINDWVANCVTCGSVFPNTKAIIKEHLSGKRHKNIFETLLKNTSKNNFHPHCSQEVTKPPAVYIGTYSDRCHSNISQEF